MLKKASWSSLAGEANQWQESRAWRRPPRMRRSMETSRVRESWRRVEVTVGSKMVLRTE
jgi:hypothetical protein